MKIKIGTLLKIKHNRKGTFMGMAYKDFDSEKEEFYPIRVAIKNENIIKGLNNDWNIDEEIPCRASLCEIEIIKTLKGGIK